ncbi:MAG TPA: AAA family ATPase [Clostridia bacterium]|nr:AAA family ATPase [Clostridia bacterium]
MDERELAQETEWLARVLGEARRQYDECAGANERLEAEARETNRELWEEVGPLGAGGGLEQIADFMGYIDAMKRQGRSHAALRGQRTKLERMLLSPYFGRVDFRKNGEDEARPAYIGLANLVDADYRALVCDWRAPVASLFYDYETGPAAYDCPRGRIEGELTLKRQYRIRGGRLEYCFDSSLKIDDEILQQLLGRSAEGRMKAIVTSIQREQNRAIRDERGPNLIVCGPAGSGKTSVALHRAAYLLYRHRDRLSAQNILILSPNRVFADYISDVLPELGEEDIPQATFAERMRPLLPRAYKKEDYAGLMEYLLGPGGHTAYARRTRGIRFKSSARFLALLEMYAAELSGAERSFAALELGGETLASASELSRLYNREYRAFPLKKRLGKLRARCLFLLENWEQGRARILASGKYPPGSDAYRSLACAVKREVHSARARVEVWTAFDPVALYRDFISGLAGRQGEGISGDVADICADTLENLGAKQLFYEDQAPLLYLAALLGDAEKDAQTKFVLVDEAQDYTILQIKLLRLWFGGAGVTLLGDPDQAINPYMNLGGFDALEGVFPPGETQRVELDKSYRSTAEIAAFARALLPEKRWGELAGRHGQAPATLYFPDEALLRRTLAADAAVCLAQGYRSVGIIARAKHQAAEICRSLKGKLDAKAILCGDEEFASGVVVIPAYLAKGLEFDVVLLYDAPGEGFRREQERLLFYTACTRALHELRLYRVGDGAPQ